MNEVIYKISKLEIIQIAGGIGIVISSIISLIYYIFQEKFKQSLKFQFDKQVESVRGEIQKNNNTYNNLFNSFLSNYGKIQDERIEFCKQIWTIVLEIKDGIPAPISLSFSILTDDELNTLRSEKPNSGVLDLYKEIKNISDKEIHEFAKSNSNSLEKIRPFITDKLFYLVYIYRIIVLRSVHLFFESVKKDKPSTWKNDNQIQQILKANLNESEYKAVYEHNFPTYSQMLNMLESQILVEIRTIISANDLDENSKIYLDKIAQYSKIVLH